MNKILLLILILAILIIFVLLNGAFSITKQNFTSNGQNEEVSSTYFYPSKQNLFLNENNCKRIEYYDCVAYKDCHMSSSSQKLTVDACERDP